MNYTLPKRLDIHGAEYAIRWDFRAALDICAALSDPELDDRERALAALMIFYPDFDAMPAEHVQEALRQCFWFLNGGEEERGQRPQRKLMDWEQDFNLIVGPVNRVLGADVRGMEQLHWWTFLAAYMEIGDCLFAQVVAIRKKRAEGRKLSKEDRAFYRENHELVDLRTHYTEEEEAVFAMMAGAAAKEVKTNAEI